MSDLFITDEKGRNVYYVYNLTTPSGSMIRTIKYDFGTKGREIAFVARDCLDTLGYKYDNAHPNKAIYKYVSKENIINGKDTKTKDVYIQVDEHHVKPVILVALNGFFELVTRSNMPDAIKFQYWVNNEVLPALYRGENMDINIHNNGGIFESIDSANNDAGIPTIRGTKADQIKELITNYGLLSKNVYSMVVSQKFKKAFWNKYQIDISKLKGSDSEPIYKKIVSNGLYEPAKDVLNELISQCSSANTGYTAEEATQLTNAINDLSYKNNVYKDFINSVPNCTIIDGIPYQRKRVVKRLTDEQIDSINDYANKYGVDTVEAMHELFD